MNLGFRRSRAPAPSAAGAWRGAGEIHGARRARADVPRRSGLVLPVLAARRRRSTAGGRARRLFQRGARPRSAHYTGRKTVAGHHRRRRHADLDPSRPASADSSCGVQAMMSDSRASPRALKSATAARSRVPAHRAAGATTTASGGAGRAMPDGCRHEVGVPAPANWGGQHPAPVTAPAGSAARCRAGVSVGGEVDQALADALLLARVAGRTRARSATRLIRRGCRRALAPTRSSLPCEGGRRQPARQTVAHSRLRSRRRPAGA